MGPASPLRRRMHGVNVTTKMPAGGDRNVHRVHVPAEIRVLWARICSILVDTCAQCTRRQTFGRMPIHEAVRRLGCRPRVVVRDLSVQAAHKLILACRAAR